MEKKTTKWGRILSLGLLGATLAAAIAIPSALANNADAAGQNGQSAQKQDVQRGRGPANREGQGPLFDMEGVTVTVEYLDNGVKETFVAQDQSVIARMKQRVTRLNNADDKLGEDAKIDVVAEATATGMVVTTTSADADTIARIINRAKIRELEKKLNEAGVDIRASITRSVTETADGVVITLSSTNADVAGLLKLREKYPHEGLRLGMQPGNRPDLPPGRMGKGLRGSNGLKTGAAQQEVTQ